MLRDRTQPNENSTDTTTDTNSGEELPSDADIKDIREEFQRLQGNTLGFDNLLDEGCEPGKLAHYILALRAASWGNLNLERDPTRIGGDTLKSLVERTLRVAKDWDKLFRTGFGKEVIRLAIRRMLRASPEDLQNIMQRALVVFSVLVLSVSLALAQSKSPKSLDIYVIDVEGGNAVLFVAPSGESMLVDTGNAREGAVRRLIQKRSQVSK